MKRDNYYSSKFLNKSFKFTNKNKKEFIETFRLAWLEMDHVGDGKKLVELQKKYSKEVFGYSEPKKTTKSKPKVNKSSEDKNDNV